MEKGRQALITDRNDPAEALFFSWKTAHAAVISVFSAVSILAPQSLSAVIACIYGLPAFILLLIILKIDLRRGANLLSLSRVFLGISVCILLHIAAPSSVRLLSALIVTTAALTDFADGIAARKNGPSESGALLDEEADAFFIFILSLTAVHFFGYPPWLIFIGLIRYLFLLLFLFGKKVSIYPPLFKRYSRFTCALAAAALTAAYYPVISVSVGRVINFCSLIFLVVSFLWESLFVFRIPEGKSKRND
jgi:phosphatidylglycerophosphate synthase